MLQTIDTKIIICFTLWLLACHNDDNDPVAIKQQRMTEISENVDAIIADKSCGGADDCASIAWGSKPCGGPWSYLVYAPSNIDVSQLEQLVGEYNQLQDEVNQLTGAASDCSVEVEPEVECVENRCRRK